MKKTVQSIQAWQENPIWIRLSIGVWLIALVVISVMVWIDPVGRTLTDLYRDTTQNWLHQRPLFTGPGGMNYLPHFSLLFYPFDAMPIPIGDIVWRWTEAIVLVWGIWRVVRHQFEKDAVVAFAWVLLLALPLSLGAIRYGQANALLSGVMLHAIASLSLQQWWRAAGWLILALAIKPLALVMILLVPFAYSAMRWRLVEAFLLFYIVPFLFASVDYVLWQYFATIQNLGECSVVREHRFANLTGLFRTFGFELPNTVDLFLRLVASLGTLGVWLWIIRCNTQPARGLWLLSLTTAYLMLFNPMNETNGYIILAPAISIWAVFALSRPQFATLGWWLVILVLSAGLLPEPLRPLFGNAFGLFWYPLITIAFLWSIIRFQLNQSTISVATPSTTTCSQS